MIIRICKWLEVHIKIEILFFDNPNAIWVQFAGDPKRCFFAKRAPLANSPTWFFTKTSHCQEIFWVLVCFFFFWVNLGENSGIETVQFCGASRFFEMTDTELSKDITEEGCTRFTAHTVGNAADNPDHALDLTQLQKNRLITALYTDVSSFTVVFAATPGQYGRNIIFSTVGPLCGKYFF